jgi:hypothetical protein
MIRLVYDRRLLRVNKKKRGDYRRGFRKTKIQLKSKNGDGCVLHNDVKLSEY